MFIKFSEVIITERPPALAPLTLLFLSLVNPSYPLVIDNEFLGLGIVTFCDCKNFFHVANKRIISKLFLVRGLKWKPSVSVFSFLNLESRRETRKTTEEFNACFRLRKSWWPNSKLELFNVIEQRSHLFSRWRAEDPFNTRDPPCLRGSANPSGISKRIYCSPIFESRNPF